MIVPYEPYVTALRDLIDALDHRGIRWAVAGAVAANNYRDETRTTHDLDVLLALADNRLSEVQDALLQRGWVTTARVQDVLLRVHHSEAGRIDVMVSGTDYELEALDRAIPVCFDKHLSFKSLAIEDVVISKLIASRFRDNADIESILVTRPAFDWEYMARWFTEFKLWERFRLVESTALNSGLISTKDSDNSNSVAPDD